MFRVTSLTAMSDRQMNRLIKRIALILVVLLVAFVGFYVLDRFRLPAAPIIDREVAALEAAVQKDPADLASRGRLADLYTANGRYADAVVQYQAVLETGKADEQAHMGLAIAYKALGETDKARTDFQAVVDIAKSGEMAKVDPMLEAAYFGLGSIAIEQGKPDEAVAQLEKALAITRSDADALNLIAAAYAATGQTDKAIDAAKAAIAFVPTGWAEPYQTLAGAYTAQGKTEMAAWATAMADFAAGNVEQAEAGLTALADGGPAAIDAQIGLGIMAETAGDTVAAEAWYSKVVAVEPRNGAAVLGLSRVRDVQSAPGHASPSPLPSLPAPGDLPGGNG
jgi:tetratricopeptide (TPR) repeat protein